MHMADHSGGPCSPYILQKHVDVIKSFCSTVRSVNRGNEGGRVTEMVQEGEKNLDSTETKTSERRTSSRGPNITPFDS